MSVARNMWAAAAMLALAAHAADDEAARAQLEQKLRLTATLMADGSAAQRIIASGDARANAHLDEGRVHYALARDLLAKGDLPNARREADEALRHLGLARRMVPDAPARQAALQQRHQQMLAHLERLIDGWRTRTGPSDAEDGDLLAAISLIETARAFAQQARYEESVHTLALAEGHVLTGMNRALHARTLDYTHHPRTPAEEVEQELARLNGLVELVPLALADLRPRPEAVALIERYAQAGSALRVQAQQQMQAGHTQQALASVRSALMYVQRALSSAGLAMPQPTEPPP